VAPIFVRCREGQLGTVTCQFEGFQNLYELAKDQLSEYSYFRKEYEPGAWIIIMLVAKVIAMPLYVSVHWYRY